MMGAMAGADNRQRLRLAAMLALELGGGIAALLGGLLLARHLGMVQTGIYYLAATILFHLLDWAGLGLARPLVRRLAPMLAEGRTVAAILLRVLAAVAVAGCALGGLLAAGAAHLEALFRQPGLAAVLGVMAFILPLAALAATLAAALRAAGRALAATALGGVCVQGGFVLLLVLLAPDGARGAALLLAAVHLALLAALSLCCARLLLPGPDADEAPAPSLASLVSLPAIAILLLERGYADAARLLMGALGGAAEVAAVAICLQLASAVQLGTRAANQLLQPRVATLLARGERRRLQLLVGHSQALVLLWAVPLAAALATLAAPVLAWYGADFAVADNALRVFALATLGAVLTGPTGCLLSMAGMERRRLFNVALASLLALVAGFWLIPALGLMGAALMYALGLAVGNLLAAWQVRRHLGLHSWRPCL